MRAPRTGIQRGLHSRRRENILQEVVAIERFHHHVVSARLVCVLVILGCRVASGDDHQVECALFDQLGGVVAVLRRGDLEQARLIEEAAHEADFLDRVLDQEPLNLGVRMRCVHGTKTPRRLAEKSWESALRRECLRPTRSK